VLLCKINNSTAFAVPSLASRTPGSATVREENDLSAQPTTAGTCNFSSKNWGLATLNQKSLKKERRRKKKEAVCV